MRVNSIKYNALMNIVLTLSNIVFPLITFPYISRVLSPEGVGITNFFFAIGNYSVLIATLGMGTYGIRQISKSRNDKEELSKTMQELIIINLVMSLFVLSILIILTFFIEKFNNELGLVIITCLTVLSSVFSLGWLYSGLEQYDYITKRSLFFKIISLILIFILVKDREDYIVYSSITLFSTLGSNIMNVYHSRKYVSFKLKKNLKFKKHIKPILYLFSSLLAVNVYTNLDTVMLGFVNGDEAVGLYSVASKIKWLLLMLITSGSAVLLPRLSLYVSNKERDKFNKILKDTTSLILMISIPMAIYFIFMAKDSIKLLGGESFLEATFTMQILMPILIISGFSNIMGNQILLPLNKEKYFMYAVTVGAIINLILNVFLIPIYGISGAAIATLVAEFGQMSIQWKFSKDYLRENISINTILNIISSVTISSIFLYLLLDSLNYSAFINLVISSVQFFCTYVVALFVLREKILIELFKNIKKSFIKK
ncbi:flippase [Gemella parahaemolysans]|jgi:putative LPS biosynthesis related flippase